MKHKFTLDDDEPLFEEWSFLLFRSSEPAYSFADTLNRLYDYRLARVDDMMLDGVAWPLFQHHDPVRHLLFFLAEQPPTAVGTPWAARDKLLIVRGETADNIVGAIHLDFTAPPPFDQADLLAREHAALLDSLLADFTVALPLDFATQPTTSKAAKERALAEQYCNAILTHIETRRLDLSPEERIL